MEKTDYMRSIIEVAVKKGLNYIVDHPKRGLRNLLDLGEYFASGRFQKSFFEIAHEILENEDSFYYDAIEDLVKNTNTDTITTFGINLGYNSFTYGAGIIRQKEEELDCHIPWLITFDFREKSSDHLTESDISNIIEKGREVGIYCYVFLLDNNDILDDLYPIFTTFDNCAFGLIVSPRIISKKTVEEMADFQNICFLVHFDGDMIDSDAQLENCIHYLRSEGCLYGACLYYDDTNYNTLIENDDIDEAFKFLNIHFALLIQKRNANSSNKDVAEIMYDAAYNSRFKVDSPAFIMDYYGDVNSVDNIISENNKNNYLLYINSSGQECKIF